MTSRLSRTLVAVLTIGVSWIGAGNVQAQQPISTIYAVGDSTSDVGNVVSLVYPDGIPPYFNPKTWDGMISSLPTEPLPGLYCNWRFSNGPIWLDYLAFFLGAGINPSLQSVSFPSMPSDYLPLPPGPPGTNYAYADARFGFGENVRYSPWIPNQQIRDENGVPITPVPSIGLQIEQLATDLDEDSLGSDDLVVMWGGANDVFIAALEQSPSVFIQAVAEARGHIERLVELGAKHIIVPNQPDSSIAPFWSGLTRAERQGLQRLTKQYNNLLEGMLAQLQVQLGNSVRIYPLDFYGLGQQLYRQLVPGKPVEFTAEAFDFLVNPAATSCVSPSIDPLASLATDTTFWDLIHPGTDLHALLAGATCQALQAAGVACQVPDPVAVPE